MKPLKDAKLILTNIVPNICANTFFQRNVDTRARLALGQKRIVFLLLQDRTSSSLLFYIYFFFDNTLANRVNKKCQLIFKNTDRCCLVNRELKLMAGKCHPRKLVQVMSDLRQRFKDTIYSSVADQLSLVIPYSRRSVKP